MCVCVWLHLFNFNWDCYGLRNRCCLLKAFFIGGSVCDNRQVQYSCCCCNYTHAVCKVYSPFALTCLDTVHVCVCVRFDSLLVLLFLRGCCGCAASTKHLPICMFPLSLSLLGSPFTSFCAFPHSIGHFALHVNFLGSFCRSALYAKI